ncbi:MAG TPA: hypothetical protein VHB50_05990, partial [Bryobacteraceae bacterium]|nr:hypothetical protein [Bryobacteraceae bacterium]
ENPLEAPSRSTTAPPPGSPGAGLGIHPLQSFRNHRVLGAVVALVITLAGLAFASFFGAPKYSATAVVYVSPRFLANLEEDKESTLQSDSEYRQYVQQNVRTINRFDILLDALKSIGSLNSVWVRPQESLERAAERLQGALAVEAVPDTYQISITLESAKKNGLAELVNAIAGTYLAKAKAEQFYSSDERVRTLLHEQQRLQQEEEEKQARLLTIAQQLGVSTFTENYVNPYDELLIKAREALADAHRKRIEADAQIGSFDDRQTAGGADSLHAFALDQAAKDPSILSLTASLNQRREQILTSISGLAPDHPGRRAGERELAEVEKERRDAYQKLVNTYSKMLLDERRASAYTAARTEQKLAEEVARQASQASTFTGSYQEALRLGHDIDQARKRSDVIQQRVDFLTLERNAPGFVRLFSSARVPDMPVKGGKRKLFAVFFVAAILLGFGVPVGVDKLDPRVHSIRDVERILGFQPVAWLMEKREAGPDFAREQSLRLANRISQDQQANGSRIFAFTSVKAQGGTSTLVIETAQALSQLGVTALAVEANAYRADPRYRKPGARGLTVVLTGNQALRSAIVESDSELPERVPVGDALNQKNLPDIQNLIEVLRDAASAYQAILVDLPPILVSVDAEYIARTADVAVLVVEAESVTKDELRRAARSLERLQVRAFSAVLNRVRSAAAGGIAGAALHEFLNGTTPARSRWSTPWLWK